MKVWCPYLLYHLGCFGRKKYVQKEWRNDKTPTWDISQKGLKRSTSSSSVHENDKFRTNNREVWRIVSFVSSFGSFTADVIWGSPSSSDCSKAFSTTSTFLDIRCFYAPSLVGSWRGRIFRSLIPSSVIIGRNLSSKRLYLGNLILVESIKVRSNHLWEANASRWVLYPTKPKRREVLSGLEETWTSVRVPTGPFFCSKCPHNAAGVT